MSRFSLFYTAFSISLLSAGYYLVSTAIQESSNNTNSVRFGSGDFFNNIAYAYDTTNKIMTLGLDIQWRKTLIDAINITPLIQTQTNSNNNNKQTFKLLDLATGTCDIAIMTAEILKNNNIISIKQQPHIIALDPSENMLGLGQGKVDSKGLSEYIQLVKGNSEAMPQFEDGSFDRITMSFG